ncbi:MAG: lipoprotein-releasing system ATP-binding protein LolD [Bacteroidia bacterium]|nr:MAG: lipoprotein-releasing system ATP-binding protein LolD [Bacteroidia bacterium]
MIIAENIYKKIGDTEILKEVSLQVNASEVVSMVGPSGAGKSTLLSILGTLEKPTSGKVFIDHQDVFAFNRNKIAAFRNRHIGFVFQFHHLLPEFTALENVFIPALIKGMSRKEAEARAKKLLDRVGLSHRIHHKPSELSGGEQQRVAVARALVNEPKVVFADEPTGNLDSHNAEALHQLFFELRDEFKQTFVIVTHNEHLAQMADRTIHIVDGKIVDDVRR